MALGASGLFWGRVGSVFLRFGVHFGSLLVPCWVHWGAFFVLKKVAFLFEALEEVPAPFLVHLGAFFVLKNIAFLLAAL